MRLSTLVVLPLSLSHPAAASDQPEVIEVSAPTVEVARAVWSLKSKTPGLSLAWSFEAPPCTPALMYWARVPEGSKGAFVHEVRRQGGSAAFVSGVPSAVTVKATKVGAVLQWRTGQSWNEVVQACRKYGPSGAVLIAHYGPPPAPASPEQEIALLRKAADAGDVEAMRELETRYFMGNKGVARDMKEAARYARMAAEKGDVSSMRSLAGFLAWGLEGIKQDYAESARWYRKCADAGDQSCQGSLGELYYLGRGLPKDAEQAFAWFRKSAEKGIPVSQLNVGIMLMKGEGAGQDAKAAADWLERAAASRNGEAANLLGDLYREGRGVPRDPARALSFYLKAAEFWSPDALRIGPMYEKGIGTERDPVEALKWYTLGSLAGFGNNYQNSLIPRDDQRSAVLSKADEMESRLPPAQAAEARRRLGLMRLQDKPLPRDPAEAVQWLELASQAGDVEARQTLKRLAAELSADQIADGRNRAARYEQSVAEFADSHGLAELATARFLRAAKSGSPDAMQKLAYRYANGQGVARNEKKAFQWFKSCAEAGGLSCMTTVATYYRNGDVVPRDFAEARRWYERYAERGGMGGESELASSYLTGDWGPQDLAKAARWYLKLAKRGDAHAALQFGYMRLEGIGTAKNERDGVRWILKAAEIGDPDARSWAGDLAREGRGVPQDPAAAMRWYERSGENPSPVDCYGMGTLYETGSGVRKDERTAMQLYRKAAGGPPSEKQRLSLKDLGSEMPIPASVRRPPDFGQVQSLGHALPVAYNRVTRAPARVKEQVESALQAMEDKAALESMRRLGLMAFEGIGIPRDFVESYYWFLRAQERGDPNAAEMLSTLEKKLTPAQLAQTRARFTGEQNPVDIPEGAIRVDDRKDYAMFTILTAPPPPPTPALTLANLMLRSWPLSATLLLSLALALLARTPQTRYGALATALCLAGGLGYRVYKESSVLNRKAKFEIRPQPLSQPARGSIGGSKMDSIALCAGKYSDEDLRKLVSKHGGKFSGRMDMVNWVFFADPGDSPERFLEGMLQEPGIQRAWQDYRRSVMKMVGSQWVCADEDPLKKPWP